MDRGNQCCCCFDLCETQSHTHGHVPAQTVSARSWCNLKSHLFSLCWPSVLTWQAFFRNAVSSRYVHPSTLRWRAFLTPHSLAGNNEQKGHKRYLRCADCSRAVAVSLVTRCFLWSWFCLEILLFFKFSKLFVNEALCLLCSWMLLFARRTRGL